MGDGGEKNEAAAHTPCEDIYVECVHVLPFILGYYRRRELQNRDSNLQNLELDCHCCLAKLHGPQ